MSFEVLVSSFSNFFDFEIVRFFQESLLIFLNLYTILVPIGLDVNVILIQH